MGGGEKVMPSNGKSKAIVSSHKTWKLAAIRKKLSKSMCNLLSQKKIKVNHFNAEP